MNKVVIDIRKNVPLKKIKELERISNDAFHNRAGTVENSSGIPYRFLYSGDENMFCCLQLGVLELEDKTDFLSYVEAWTWIDDEDPQENTDILAEIQTPIM